MRNVLILEPMSSGLDLIPAARELGLFVIICTSTPRLPAFQIADRVVNVDCQNFSQLLEAVTAINEQQPLAGIIAGNEFMVTPASHLAAHFHLPGLSADTVELVRSKYLMRQAADQAGVAVPKYVAIYNQDQLEDAANYIGFPAVIKPMDFAASLHVKKVTNKKELIAAYQAIINDNNVYLNQRMTHTVVLEQYITGPEFSVEGFVDHDKITFLSITQKILGPEPFFVEMGHIVQARLSIQQRNEIFDYMKEVIKALHVTMGPFHCEIRLTDQGPRLIELGARLAGENIIQLIELATGVSLAKITVQLHVGETVVIPPVKMRQYAGIRYFASVKGGNFEGLEGLEKLQQLRGFINCNLHANYGDDIAATASNLDRIADVIFVAPSYDELVKRLDVAEKTLTIKITE